MTFAVIDAASASLILGIVTVVFGFLATVFTGLLSYKMAQMTKEQSELKQTQKEVKRELEEVHKTTNGLNDKLMKASSDEGVARGIVEERDRVVREQAAVDRGVAAEKLRADINAGPTGSTIATVNGTLEKNVAIVKKDVQEVKGDVKDVKSEVIKDVKEGVAEAVKESKKSGRE